MLNDNWQVVAMHRGFKTINPDAYPSEDGSKQQVAKYHNEGIAIHDILAHLPEGSRKEIRRPRGELQRMISIVTLRSLNDALLRLPQDETTTDALPCWPESPSKD